jgi:hypothetical protein
MIHACSNPRFITRSASADEKGSIDEALVKAEADAPSAQLQFHGKASLARCKPHSAATVSFYDGCTPDVLRFVTRCMYCYRYRRASVEVFKVFRATLPSCTIEKASIDEAYVGVIPLLCQISLLHASCELHSDQLCCRLVERLKKNKKKRKKGPPCVAFDRGMGVKQRNGRCWTLCDRHDAFTTLITGVQCLQI